LQPAIRRHRQNLSGHSKAASRYPKIKTQITSKKMLPIMSLIPLLQPIARAHIRERHREKTDRHHHEPDVLHTPTPRENAAADFLRS
jgi:hypothetical protein